MKNRYIYLLGKKTQIIKWAHTKTPKPNETLKTGEDIHVLFFHQEHKENDKQGDFLRKDVDSL